ncbi:hypothetical protein L1987_87471 [Smallanthus sonchifolius]|nr:hypothetical protein L1987_87471 [Smallanthus sonchifolius]
MVTSGGGTLPESGKDEKIYSGTITSSIKRECSHLLLNEGFIASAGVEMDRAEQYQGKVTTYVIIACIVAAVGGSIFGYDIGISGNLISTSTFLQLSTSNSA